MIKHGYENINVENPLDKKLDKLINYFVEFYGEENRKYIEDRINNTQFVFVDHSVDVGINEIKAHFKDLLSKATSKEDKEYLESEEKRLTELYYSSPIRQSKKVYTEKKNKIVTDYIISKMGIANTDENVAKLTKFVPSFLYFVSADRSKFTLEQWDYNTFMLGFFALLAGELNGSSITKSGEEKIASLMGADAKQIVKEVKKIESEELDRILEDKKYRDLFQGIIDSNVIGVRENISFIRNFMLNDSEIGGGQFTSVDPSKPLVPVSLCIVSNPMDLADSAFIHEVNHVVSASSKLVAKHHEIRCGFGRMEVLLREDGSVLDLTGRSGWQRYQAINEVVNDYMSVKIYEKMAEDGFKIGFLDTTKTLYSSVFPVVDLLFDEYMDELKQTYITGKNVFAEKIGERNFNHLADAISEMFNFCENYDRTQRVYEVLQEKLKEGNHFDIFELANDTSIQWGDQQVETYLNSVRKIDEIICDIDDYVEANDENIDFDEDEIDI